MITIKITNELATAFLRGELHLTRTVMLTGADGVRRVDVDPADAWRWYE